MEKALGAAYQITSRWLKQNDPGEYANNFPCNNSTLQYCDTHRQIGRYTPSDLVEGYILPHNQAEFYLCSDKYLWPKQAV